MTGARKICVLSQRVKKSEKTEAFSTAHAKNAAARPEGKKGQTKGVFHCQSAGRFFFVPEAILKTAPMRAVFSWKKRKHNEEGRRGGCMEQEQKGRPRGGEVMGAVALILALALALAGTWHRTGTARAVSAGAVLDVGRSESEMLRLSGEVSRTVIPLGRAVGIKMFTDGVMVVGISEIETGSGAVSPASDCGLREGDIITHINDVQVDSIEQVRSLLQTLAGAPMSIRALRGDKQIQTTASAVCSADDGVYRLGAWIRDSMAGIGTMTFYDPQSGVFGALGHGVNDVDTSLLVPLESGSIMYAQVTDVKKGTSGDPGELHGAFEVERDLGELYANTPSGIFGVLGDESLVGTAQPMEVASRREVKVGEATILSNIAGETVEEYTVEITHVYPAGNGDTRNLMLKVTDERLLSATGGIVQGMSGSPIIQNGKLVGAVTHVLINDPTQGYGILAENMLSEAAAEAQAQAS